MGHGDTQLGDLRDVLALVFAEVGGPARLELPVAELDQIRVVCYSFRRRLLLHGPLLGS